MSLIERFYLLHRTRSTQEDRKSLEITEKLLTEMKNINTDKFIVNYETPSSGNFCENFIFTNSVKRHTCNV